MKNILDITRALSIDDSYIIPYGWDKAKIDLKYMDQLKDKKDGKLVLVTAITPTKAGEGKTTTTIGLHDGLRRIGVNSLAVLREPSLGPVFGVKGGAVGALKSTIVPSDDINLHFTGDFHALTSTINLIAAMIENHLYQGNELNIDPDKIVWTRALDMNDRSLRSITINAEGSSQEDSWYVPQMEYYKNVDPAWAKAISKRLFKEYSETNYAGDNYIRKYGSAEKAVLAANRKYTHKSEFVITVASELMAIFCIANDEAEFLDRTEDIIVAYNYDEQPVRVRDLHIRGAIQKLMHTAMNPNIVQTLEENPVLVHGGPFANIAHGCNSVIATKLGLKLADVVVTEAGFGADLGAEKFLDIKCQRANLKPDCIVLVATIRALKLHGGVKFEDLDKENIEAMKAGICNLEKHYNNMCKYGVPVVVAINKFPSDTDAELKALTDIFEDDWHHWGYSINSAAIDGSSGSEDLAKHVMQAINLPEEHKDKLGLHFKPLYDLATSDDIKLKIETICRQIYGASKVEYTDLAEEQIKKYTDMGYGNLAVCMAKTPNSLTSDPKILGAPTGFTIPVREVRLSAGAGFIVVMTGSIVQMPGLPKNPLACQM